MLFTMASNVPTVNSISVAGSYSINPTTLANEPVTGVTGCSVQPKLALTMGVLGFKILNAGLYPATLPASFTQASSTGAGTGAAFGTPTWQANGTNTIYGRDDT